VKKQDNSYRKDFFINLQHIDDGVEKVLEIGDICLKIDKEIAALKQLKSSVNLDEDELFNYYLFSLLYAVERESGNAHYFVKYKNKILNDLDVKAKDFDIVYQSISKLLTD